MTQNTLKQHIGYWINQLGTEVHAGFQKRLSQHDITVPQWCILVSIFDDEATSIGELSKYIGIDKASISRVVERLVVRELILHTQGHDKRSGKLTLTQKGYDIVPKLILAAEENEEEFFGHMTHEDLELFRRLLRKMLFNIPSITLDGWIKL